MDPFFTDPSRKRKHDKLTSRVPKRRRQQESESSEDESGDIFEDALETEDKITEEEAQDAQEKAEEEAESAADKRRRLAKQYLAELQEQAGEYDAKELDEEIISARLERDVGEEKGYVYKFVGQAAEVDGMRMTRVSNKGLTSVAVHYPFIYTTSKDLELAKWDVSGNKPKKVKWVRGKRSYGDTEGHSDEIMCCAVSSDGKYIVTGGKDQKIAIWSENLALMGIIPVKSRNGAVYGLTFRDKSDQFYAACGDLRVRTFSAAQQAQLETLYGHQDLVVDISALSMERCVTVGSRDRTAMLWKIADETRLTFRGGDSIERFERMKKQTKDLFRVEGSMDCVSMVDNNHFVTGSDNGNVCLWSVSKKKPVFMVRQAHGIEPEIGAAQASADKDSRYIPDPQPYWITSIHSVPFSDIFFTGSWNGTIKMWKIDENLRTFEAIGELKGVNGVVTRIDCHEGDKEIRLYASVSKEPRLGRWTKKGRNGIYTAVVKV